MYSGPTPGLMKAIRATREQHRSDQTVLALGSVKYSGGKDDKKRGWDHSQSYFTLLLILVLMLLAIYIFLQQGVLFENVDNDRKHEHLI